MEKASRVDLVNGYLGAWLAEYLHELTAFPKGKHDDQVDSTAQMLDWLKRAGGGPAAMPASGICTDSSPRRRARRRPSPHHYRCCCPSCDAGDRAALSLYVDGLKIRCASRLSGLCGKPASSVNAARCARSQERPLASTKSSLFLQPTAGNKAARNAARRMIKRQNFMADWECRGRPRVA